MTTCPDCHGRGGGPVEYLGAGQIKQGACPRCQGAGRLTEEAAQAPPSPFSDFCTLWANCGCARWDYPTPNEGKPKKRSCVIPPEYRDSILAALERLREVCLEADRRRNRGDVPFQVFESPEYKGLLAQYHRTQECLHKAAHQRPWWRVGILLRRPWRADWRPEWWRWHQVWAWLTIAHDCQDPVVACSCSGGFRFPRTWAEDKTPSTSG